MRRSAVLLAPAALAATLAAVGSLVADQVVDVRRSPRYAYRVVAADDRSVTLRRSRATERVGTYGLAYPGGHAVAGEVLGRTRTTVVRPIVRVVGAPPRPGRAALDHVDVGDPASAFGFDFFEVDLESDVGVCPAWVVPASGDTWAIVVHGYGGRRSSALSFLPILRDLGITAVVPAYRNDPDAPPSPDRRYHLGETEWRDVDAAISYALSSGADRVVLYGWSMGAAIVLQAWARSASRGRVAALVLDSPVVDWRSVLRHLGQRRHVPRTVVRCAMRLVERRVDVDFDDLDWLRRAGELDVATYLVHGDDDLTVPFGPSVELARLRPDLVTLRVVPGAGHVGSWNVDPEAYARSLGEFLAPVLAGAPA
ncbi:MAG: alpha/beta hydrolase [Actinomycetota bacterium]|nr:alpha/beta hydrolase [Actinomycetota bacterium]